MSPRTGAPTTCSTDDLRRRLDGDAFVRGRALGDAALGHRLPSLRRALASLRQAPAPAARGRTGAARRLRAVQEVRLRGRRLPAARVPTAGAAGHAKGDALNDGITR